MNRDLYEIRCCCVPEKLLGWVPCVPRDGHAIFTITKPQTFDIFNPSEYPPAITVERLALPMALYRDGDREWMAIKSQETPIEKLRRIPGFIENK